MLYIFSDIFIYYTRCVYMLRWQVSWLTAPLPTPPSVYIPKHRVSPAGLNRSCCRWTRAFVTLYLVFVPSVHLYRYFRHFHGILKGLRPAVSCSHGCLVRPGRDGKEMRSPAPLVSREGQSFTAIGCFSQRVCWLTEEVDESSDFERFSHLRVK